MKKILVMCGMYHPNYSANGICVKNIIDEFINRNYDVTCICNDYGTFKNNDIQDGCKIFRIKRKLLQRMEDYFASKKLKSFLKITSFLKQIQLFFNSWRWPFVSKAYTYRFYKKACKLHKKNRFDIVISVYCPIDSLYAGYLLKKKYEKIFFIPYYLDALAGGWGPKSWSEEKTNERMRYYEEKIDSVSDLIISMKSSKKYHVSNEILNYNKKRYYLDVPLLKESVTRAKEAKKNNTYGLFVGNMSSSHRNVRFILDFFLQYCKKYNIDFYLIGDTKSNNNFEQYENDSNGRIKYLGKKGRDEVAALEKNASFLVNIGSINPNTVPGKIFEYFSYNKPIISTYSIDNEPSIIYLKKYGNYYLLNEKNIITDQVLESVNSFLNSNITKKRVNIYKFFYDNTPAAFVDLIESKFGKE